MAVQLCCDELCHRAPYLSHFPCAFCSMTMISVCQQVTASSLHKVWSQYCFSRPLWATSSQTAANLFFLLWSWSWTLVSRKVVTVRQWVSLSAAQSSRLRWPRVKYRPYREANSFSASQEIPGVLLKPNVHCHRHTSPPFLPACPLPPHGFEIFAVLSSYVHLNSDEVSLDQLQGVAELCRLTMTLGPSSVLIIKPALPVHCVFSIYG